MKQEIIFSTKHEQMSEKCTTECKVLNCFEYFHILVSAVNGCVSTSHLGSLVGAGITSFTLGLKICE